MLIILDIQSQSAINSRFRSKIPLFSVTINDKKSEANASNEN